MLFVRAVTGPVSRLLVIGTWIALAVGGWVLHERLPDVTSAGQGSFLPRKAESTRAAAALKGGFSRGDDIPAIVVFARASGLTPADKVVIRRVGQQLDRRDLAGATPILDPLTGAGSSLGGNGLLAKSGDAALIALAIDADVRDAIKDDVAAVRALVRSDLPSGLQAHVTGAAGIAADLELEADTAGRTLLLATLGLVLVLLLLVYRAPVLAVMPLVVVGAAYLLAAGIAYLLIKAGAIEVNSEGTMLLVVLAFGAGTDYSLLLVQRYRDELARSEDDLEALRRAVLRSAPAIAASGGTVIAAMLVLMLANLESTAALGPVLAIGIAMMLLASFTLLPAVLALLGPRAFWPGRAEPPRTTRWQRVAGLVQRRSGRLIVGIVAVLAVCALGNLVSAGSIGFGQGFTRPTDATRGTAILDANFPPGLSSPAFVVARRSQQDRVTETLNGQRGVAVAAPAPVRGRPGVALVAVLLRDDPDSTAAADAVRDVRAALRRTAPGALVGGITAENVDVQVANADDTRLIVPVTLLVVGLVLVGLLRALVVPFLLILTVVASFAATLGIATVLFTRVLGEDGLAFNLTLLAFLFLVALGVDYNIFLMHRAREEARAGPAREAMLRALVATGGVITGAGLILAGTFATLTLLPLAALVQIGGTVALGILLDTFVVRALLVPAITYRLGEGAWWPARRRPEPATAAADQVAHDPPARAS